MRDNMYQHDALISRYSGGAAVSAHVQSLHMVSAMADFFVNSVSV